MQRDNYENGGGSGRRAIRQLSLESGGHRFIFKYAAGREADVIDAMADLATREDSGFDWIDAVVLSYQMGKGIEKLSGK